MRAHIHIHKRQVTFWGNSCGHLDSYTEALANGEDVLLSLHNARTRKHNNEIKLSIGHNTIITNLDIDHVPTALRKVTMITTLNIYILTTPTVLSHKPVCCSYSKAATQTTLTTSLPANTPNTLRAPLCVCCWARSTSTMCQCWQQRWRRRPKYAHTCAAPPTQASGSDCTPDVFTCRDIHGFEPSRHIISQHPQTVMNLWHVAHVCHKCHRRRTWTTSQSTPC